MLKRLLFMALRGVVRNFLRADSRGTTAVNLQRQAEQNPNHGAQAGGNQHALCVATDTVDARNITLNDFPQLPPTTPYDVVIRINSLAALNTSGWDILLGQNAMSIDPEASTSDDTRGVIVAVVGSYNRGKTFVINKLCDVNLPSGNLIYTEGISMRAGRGMAEHIIFVDTAGSDTAIPKDKLNDKKATEALLKEIALHLSSFVIIIVNRLRATDQTYIDQVIGHCKSSGTTKNIIIVHNLSDVENEDDVKEVIEREVRDLFVARDETMNLRNIQTGEKVKFFCSEQSGMEVRHFIFAKDGSDAAKIWNKQSVDGIMMILQTATAQRRNLAIVDELTTFVNNRLPQIFNNDENESAPDGNNEQKFKIKQHSSKPCIVLARRAEQANLDETPEDLKVSPQLLYDDAGYFIGISSWKNGQWTPRFSLYETPDAIYVFVELAGFKKGTARVEVVEEAVIIKGTRPDFIETLSSSTRLQEKIPFGQFNLEIPLKGYKIEPDETNVEREDGLYKIICPKKKPKSKIFD